jgi:hypothetical protein
MKNRKGLISWVEMMTINIPFYLSANKARTYFWDEG